MAIGIQKIRRVMIIVAMLIFSVANLSAQTAGEYLKMTDAVPGGYKFWYFVPEDYKIEQHKMPLIIFLHGASLCGKDLMRVRRYGVLHAIDKGRVIPAFVLAPQNPGGAWKPSKINDLLDWAKENYNVDTTRVYVLGMSLGGYGTLDFVGTYPEKVAAAMALCGGCSLRDLSGLGKLPLWIMHGTADRAVGVKESKRVVDYLQENGQDKLLRFDWLEGGNHGVLARLFYLQKTYDWLISHTLNKRKTEDCIDITWDDIKTTYQDMKKLSEDYDHD